MATEEFEKDVIDRLARIEIKLDNDFRALHGNGHPGLLAEMETAKKEIELIKARQSWWGTALAGWLSILFWLVTTGIAVVGLFKGGK